MAWLSGLAGKAEHLLNKIDQNTAAVLSKEKNDYDQLTQVATSNHSPLHLSSEIGGAPNTTMDSPMHIFSPAGSSLRALNAHTVTNMEEDLITYLNTPTKSIGAITTGPPTPSSLIVEHSADSTDSITDLLIHSDRTSPEPLRIILDLSDEESSNVDDVADPSDLRKVNVSLRNEIEKLRNELLVTMHVEKSIENEDANFQQKLDTLRREYEYRLTQQRLEMEHLMKRSRDGDAKKNFKAAKRNFNGKTEILSSQQMDNLKEIDMLREMLRTREIETSETFNKLSDVQSSLERCRSELNSTRVELEQHRARAMKTLQEKEKLIADLRNDSNAGSDNATMIVELNQLRRECEALRDENLQVREQLRVVREELINTDLRVEETSRKSIEASREAHEVVSAERRKRLEAEEEARVHSEETRGLRDELANQLNNWSTKFRKQETEITRLRSQLSAASTPTSAVESRLSSLTQTLVSKQQALESLTTEKNALRLQLEKIEQEYKKMLASSRKNGSYNSVNDTDDAKAQVPAFFLESPFDTGVARRVKRAYSTLDAISVRTGVFLRRYPLARIFVVIYIALLQFWVLVVLLSQSPDAH